MAVANTTIAVDQGADIIYGFYFFSPDPSGGGDQSKAVPFDVTGKHARLQVRASQDPTSTLLLSLIDTGGSPGIVFAKGTATGFPALSTIAVNNGFTVAITATQSLAMPGSTWYFDCFLDDIATGKHDLYLQGPFVVNVTATR